MRIISGSHKGRRIQAPKNLPVRPTTDRAKESLFSILTHHVDWEEASVLDLFAGTGNLSYEAASRGANRVLAVDRDAKCVRFITQTAAALEMPVEARKSDVNTFLETWREPFDLILADPPYDLAQEALQDLAGRCREPDLLKSGGVLVIEHSPHRDLSEVAGFQQVRRYGSTHFSFFGGKA